MLQTSKDRTHLNTANYRADVVRNPPFVTFPINETMGMKSSFCNIFDEKKGVTSLVLLQKCTIFANRQLAYGLWEKSENQEIRLHHYYEMAVAAPMR